jgi:hypothetical protein
MALLLRSPLHRVVSGRFQLISYRGRRSGATITTPTQYVELDDRVGIVVGRWQQKRWWRNFEHPWPIDVLVRGQWRHMEGAVRRGSVEGDRSAVIEVLAAFGAKYGDRQVPPLADALVVVCGVEHPSIGGRNVVRARVEPGG